MFIEKGQRKKMIVYLCSGIVFSGVKKEVVAWELVGEFMSGRFKLSKVQDYVDIMQCFCKILRRWSGKMYIFVFVYIRKKYFRGIRKRLIIRFEEIDLQKVLGRSKGGTF